MAELQRIRSCWLGHRRHGRDNSVLACIQGLRCNLQFRALLPTKLTHAIAAPLFGLMYRSSKAFEPRLASFIESGCGLLIHDLGFATTPTRALILPAGFVFLPRHMQTLKHTSSFSEQLDFRGQGHRQCPRTRLADGYRTAVGLG